MKKLTIYLSYLFGISLIFSLSFNALNAQPWTDKLSDKQKSNFFEIKKSFESYWKDKDITEKGKGWKAFKRWEWFWEQRLYPSGDFPNPMQTYLEKKKIESKNIKINGKLSVGSWTPLGPSTNAGGYGGLGRVNCVREDPSSSSIIWAGAASGGLWKSTDGGSTWTTNTDLIGSIGVTDIAFGYNNNMYIATGDGDAADIYSVGVLKSTDGGATWNSTGMSYTQNQTIRISRLLIIPGGSTTTDIVYSAGSNGINKTTNSGASWTLINSNWVRDMEFKPGTTSTIYASTYSPVKSIIRSVDGGTNWTTLGNGLPSSGAQRIALGVTPANSSYIYTLISGNDYGFYGLYQSTNSGDTWTLKSNTPNIMGWNTSGSDAGGQGWYDLALAVNQTNENEIYTGGINVWKSANGGSTWSCVSNWQSNMHADQHDLWFAPGSARLYAGNDGGVYKSTNTGSSWNWLGSGLQITQFYRLGCSASNSNLVIAGAQDNGTKLEKTGNWSDVIGGDGMEAAIDPTNANIMYGELYYGAIYKSTNGSSFSRMTLPSEYNSSYGAWVTPYLLNPSNSSILFAGYMNVFKTTNSGSAWTKISNFTSGSLTVLQVAPSNTNYIYASTGTSTLNMTSNGGTSWSSFALPSGLYLTYLAINQTDPLKIWASFSGYSAGNKVYYSTNGGANWNNLSGTLPNVPVNCIIYQKDYYNRLYIGTDIGVFYRDDNTTDWVPFNSNLPNVVIDELEIQYGSMKLRAATYGRGIWETDIPSGSVSLSAPSLVSPANYATNVDINPALTWSPVSGATGYAYQYSADAGFAGATDIPLLGTSANLTGLSYNTIYYWRVKANNGSSSSSYSDVWSFTTISFSSLQPTLIAPSNGATGVSTNPTLSWNSVTGAVGYAYQYSIDPGFTGATDNPASGTSANLTGLPYNTKYYWRVKASDGSTFTSWSVVWSFTIISNTLSAPTLTYPANNASNIPTSLTFLWNSVTNATGYILQYAKSSSFSPYTQITVDNKASVSVSGLTKKTTYYWRVLATASGFPNSAWSTVFHFKTRTNGRIDNAEDIEVATNQDIPVSVISYPNPFNSTAHFEIQVMQSQIVNLMIFDVFGRTIATLMNQQQKPGTYNVDFDGSKLPSGIYFYKIEAGDFTETKIMTLVK
jgi:hypothetical protein